MLFSVTISPALSLIISQSVAYLISSQPRMAHAENGDASVSIELLIRAILATGASPQDIGKVIASVG